MLTGSPVKKGTSLGMSSMTILCRTLTETCTRCLNSRFRAISCTVLALWCTRGTICCTQVRFVEAHLLQNLGCIWYFSLHSYISVLVVQVNDSVEESELVHGRASWGGIRVLNGIRSTVAAVRSSRAVTVAPTGSACASDRILEADADLSSGGFSASVTKLQATAFNSRRTTPQYKLSLKVMCGAGHLYLYHCGGNVLQTSSEEPHDKIARWEFFLGDLACPPYTDLQGVRQIMAQISSIEICACAGTAVLSEEMLSALDSTTAHVRLFQEHRAARLLSISRSELAADLNTLGSSDRVLDAQPIHISARAAALFRMHVVDNIRQRIEAGHHDFINEIRHLTILFMGFPSLSVRSTSLDGSLQPVQDTVMIVVKVMIAFRGTLVQFRCDEKGFLAICAFGLPGVSHPNNQERGILSALQVKLHVESMGHQFACGVTTGDLLCACVGSSVRREYSMFGDAINLSARLMCKAKAGLGIVLTDKTTCSRAGAKAVFHELPALLLKGKSEPVQVLSQAKSSSERCDV